MQSSGRVVSGWMELSREKLALRWCSVGKPSFCSLLADILSVSHELCRQLRVEDRAEVSLGIPSTLDKSSQ